MVVPCYVLDNPKRHLRKQIADIADLVTAYRMPDSLFSNANITVDIVIFQRKASPNKTWHGTSYTDIDNKNSFYLADYFIQHPTHVLGKLETYKAYSY